MHTLARSLYRLNDATVTPMPVTASGLLPGGGAAAAVIGASIVVGIFAGMIAVETKRNLWAGMALGFVVGLLVLTGVHAIAVA